MFLVTSALSDLKQLVLEAGGEMFAPHRERCPSSTDVRGLRRRTSMAMALVPVLQMRDDDQPTVAACAKLLLIIS